MALKLKFTDEHGIVHINMSPNSSPQSELKDPKFDTINNRFGAYDLFGGKYEDYKTDSSGEAPHSLFRSRYNSIEEELANTPYAFATERSLRSANQLDITIDRSEISPSKDIEDDRFFHRRLSIDYDDVFRENTPAFTVTQLIHAQDRYFDLSAREKAEKESLDKGKAAQSVPRSASKSTEKLSFVLKSTPAFEKTGFVEKPTLERVGFGGKVTPGKSIERSGFERTFVEASVESRSTDSSSSVDRTTVPVASGRVLDDSAFKVLKLNSDVKTQTDPIATTVVPISVRKKEKSFAILTETPTASRPSSPRSLPVDIRQARVSPFKGRGFREETSRHNTPRTSAANSRANSPPPRRRTSSLSRIDKMASTATLLPPILLPQMHSPRNFLRENIEGIREISELNREKHEADEEKKKIEEEAAILKEMGLSEKEAKKEAVKSVIASRNNSRTNSRSNSPSKINLTSRSNSPLTKLNRDGSKSKEYINANDGLPKPVTHRSRVRSVSKSQPQSKDGSPKNSKIPKRQSSVSPKGTLSKRDNFISRRPVNNNLNQNQRYMSSSTSSIHETIRVGSQIHDKRGISQSAQHLSISPAHIKGKPPISPGRAGPPPSNKTINAKRLSPIVGTPNKSPIDDSKIGTKTGAKTITKRPIKTTSNTPATSRVTSRQPSRDTSPDKRKTTAKPATTKPISRTPSSKSIQKPSTPTKTELRKPINRTDSMKSLNRTPSTKNLTGKPPLKRSDSKLSNKSQSNGKINDIGRKDSTKDKNADKVRKETKSMSDSATDPEEIPKQDNETQYDKLTNERGELVIMTKKNIVSMTTAAITSQPLEIVTTVTNQLPATLEKAREKRNIERLSSRESLIGKDEVKIVDEKKKNDKNHGKSKKEPKEDKDNHDKPMLSDDHHKLKPLQPPYNDPQLDKVKQKIDDILKTPEISRENILTSSAKSRELPRQDSRFKNLAEKTKDDVKQSKDSISDKLTELKNQMVMQQEATFSAAKENVTSEIRTEVTKIVDSIITPVEEPKHPIADKVKEVKKDIEPIVMVVNEKKKEVTEKKKELGEKKKDLTEAVEKVNEALVKGEAEVEVQSSNVSTPGVEKILMANKVAGGNGSDRSLSNGGFPQSTSTTPKPPARTKKEQKEKEKEKEQQSPPPEESEAKNDPEDAKHKKPNICSRLMGKCKSKCCSCCIKGEEEKETEEQTERAEREKTVESMEEDKKEKQGMMSKFSLCKKKKPEVEEVERDLERAAGKGATIEFEDETKRKRKLRDIICCCERRRRVSDAAIPPRRVVDVTMSPGVAEGVVAETGCCGKKRQVERRDSILSDRTPSTCCNNRLCTWFRGMCRRREPAATSSRRASMFSKNKSLSPTLPPEDTRKKLDPALIEHTSIIRAAIPILPIVLAYFCLVCNVVVPGLGSIFSGLFCLCFGIPRFGPHDGAKYRIGSFIINLLVGAGQLFTVLFCLVGWGWSIWWGVIMIKISRKYRRIMKEAAIAEAAEAASPPVTTNNHTRA